ncbi:MAG TPA: PocR ligand-binding domain-containing protein [Candidatus Omnitrophota bacterium]|nr:PocR ligand-binding domain-containing protein [Candidatus Omnitrophota bacterium]HPD85207.1 PocR ligand-binding domain-containing protein [Candidatus Omnitrophota bacterium]HRZ04292.1 PocR ligand-binding domain-containing protein [Candidatus Omnitrophota bacterium]
MDYPINKDASRRVTTELIDRERWRLILQRFIEALQINIFIVDTEGKVFLTLPNIERYGAKLLDYSSVGSDMFSAHDSILDRFKKHGFYLEYHYSLGLHSFAVPIDIEEGKPVAYLVVGPVILTKRLDNSEYEAIAQKMGLNFRDLVDALHDIRVISFVNLRAILDLLYEVSKYVVQLTYKQVESQKKHIKLADESRETITPSARSLVYSNDFLSSLLEIALKMTRTECGSIMILDQEKGDLFIKVSRGIDKTIARNTRVKVGEGIAGLAVQEDASYVIHGTEGKNRIKSLLKRSEIKHSFIAPLKLKDSIFGVLNLHTKTDVDPLLDQKPNVAKRLSKLVSAVADSAAAY